MPRRWYWSAVVLMWAGVVACGGEGRYRRALPSDQLAPWSTRTEVRASLEGSGWCRDTKREKHASLNGSVVIERHHFDAGEVAPGAMVAEIASPGAARSLDR